MTHDEMLAQVVRGLAYARDPVNARANGLDDLRVTTLYSPWLLQTCLVCRHTFREADHVRPDPNNPQRMRHADAPRGLWCLPPDRGGAIVPVPAPLPDPAIRAAFLDGLQKHWQPAGGVKTITVPPRSALIGRKCPICRHTVRIGDTVVLCPCGRDCGGVFHQDPMQHMTCWDNWNHGQIPTHCAFTGALFLAQPKAHNE